MSRLVWDRPEDKVFESGLDRGVLYALHNQGRAWNGLISLDESPSGAEVTPHYQDGIKVRQRVTAPEYSATLTAYTYPDQFLNLNSQYQQIGEGLYADEQIPRPFGLSYRTMVGNSLKGPKVHYKIHLVYNAVAMPSNRSNATLVGDPSLEPFVWDITTTPVHMPLMRPSSHLIIDSSKTTPHVLSQLEDLIYGTPSTNPRMPTPQELVEFFYGYNFSPNGYGYGPYGLTTYGHGQDA